MGSNSEARHLTNASASNDRYDQSPFTSSVLDSLVTNLWSSSPYETKVLTETAGPTQTSFDSLTITLVPSLGGSATTIESGYSSISPTATTPNIVTDYWTMVSSATVTTSSISLSTASLWTDDFVTNTQTWPPTSATYVPTISTTNASFSETFQSTFSFSIGISEDISPLSTSDSSDRFQPSVISTIDSSLVTTSSVQFLNTSTAHLMTTNSSSSVMTTSTSFATEVMSTPSVTQVTSIFPVTEVTSTLDPFRDERLELNRKIEDLNGTVHNLTVALVVVAVILFLVVAIFIIYKTYRYWRGRLAPTALPMDGLDEKPLKRDQKSYFRPQSTYDLTDKEEVRYQSSYSNSSSSDKPDELVTFPTSGRVTSGSAGGWERGPTNIPVKDTVEYDNAGFDLGESPGPTRITPGHGNNHKDGGSSFVDVQLT